MKNLIIVLSIALCMILILSQCNKSDPYLGQHLWGCGKVLKDGTFYDIYISGRRSDENAEFLHYLKIDLRINNRVLGTIDMTNLDMAKGRIDLKASIRNENRRVMNRDASTAVYYSMVDDSGISWVFDLLEDHLDNHITFEKLRRDGHYKVHFNMAFIRDQWARPSGQDGVEHRDTLLLPRGEFSMKIR